MNYLDIKQKRTPVAKETEGDREISDAQNYIDSFATKKKDKRVAFRIQAEVYEKFAGVCESEGVPVSVKINQFIKDYLKNHG